MRFHKLGGLHPGRFLKPYQAKVVSINRMTVSQVYGYHGCRQVKRQWLNNLCYYTVSLGSFQSGHAVTGQRTLTIEACY